MKRLLRRTFVGTSLLLCLLSLTLWGATYIWSFAVTYDFDDGDYTSRSFAIQSSMGNFCVFTDLQVYAHAFAAPLSWKCGITGLDPYSRYTWKGYISSLKFEYIGDVEMLIVPCGSRRSFSQSFPCGLCERTFERTGKRWKAIAPTAATTCAPRRNAARSAGRFLREMSKNKGQKPILVVAAYFFSNHADYTSDLSLPSRNSSRRSALPRHSFEIRGHVLLGCAQNLQDRLPIAA